MQIDRRLYRTVDGRVTEDEAEAAFLLIAKGQSMSMVEARQSGVLDYLARRRTAELPAVVEEEPPATEAKAVEAGAVENKAVEQGETEDKGIRFPAESRRQGGQPRMQGR